MFLDKIVNSTKIRVEEKKRAKPLEALISEVEKLPSDLSFPFEKNLKAPGMSFICEVKKASPSKGLISPDFPYLEIAKEYEAAGAAAISVLTEPEYFLGNDRYLAEIIAAVTTPTLRKDFVIDPYQIYEAKLLGASAVLFIAEILEQDVLQQYIKIAHSLGLSALTECHSEPELYKILKTGARVIGVNNRNLDTFEVDINTAVTLRKLVPSDRIYVSESGIFTGEHVKILKEQGVDGVLVGESLMRSPDKKAQLNQLRGIV